LLGSNPAIAPCYLFNAADIEPLAVLDGGDEVACVEETIGAACIEPCKATSKEFYTESAFAEIYFVEVGYLVFSTCGGFELSRFLADCLVIEIESGDGILALRILRFLLKRDNLERVLVVRILF